jgi:hypothetical protein
MSIARIFESGSEGIFLKFSAWEGPISGARSRVARLCRRAGIASDHPLCRVDFCR